MRTESLVMLLCALHYASAHIVDDIHFYKARTEKTHETDNLPHKTLVIKSFYIKIDGNGNIAVYEDNVNVTELQTAITSSTASNINYETRQSSIKPLVAPLDHHQFNTVYNAEKVDSETRASSGKLKLIRPISTSQTLTESVSNAESNPKSNKPSEIANATVFGINGLEQRGNTNPQESKTSSSAVNLTIDSASDSESGYAHKIKQLPKQYNSESHEVILATENKEKESFKRYKLTGGFDLSPTPEKSNDRKRSYEQNRLSISYQSSQNEPNKAYLVPSEKDVQAHGKRSPINALKENKPYLAKHFESKNDRNPIITDGFYELHRKKPVNPSFTGAVTNAVNIGVKTERKDKAMLTTENKQDESNKQYKSDGSFGLSPTPKKFDDQKRSCEQNGSNGQSYQDDGSGKNVLGLVETNDNIFTTPHEHTNAAISSSSVQEVANVSPDLTSNIKPISQTRGPRVCSISRKHIVVRIRDCLTCF